MATPSGDRFTDVELENKRLPACFGYITCKILPLDEAMKELHGVLPEISRFIKLARRLCIHPNEDNLTKDEAATLYLYTMEMAEDACVYRILNQTLRIEDRSKVRPWFGYLKLMDSAVSKLPNFKGTVWRGIDKDVTKAFKKGQKIIWWSVTSCSKSVNVISSFLEKAHQSTLFNIECSTGKLIAAYTSFPNEDEVILMPGTTFEVVADPLNHRGGLNIIHLKELADDDDEEKPTPPASASPSASATTSITAKVDKMTLGKKRSPRNKLFRIS